MCKSYTAMCPACGNNDCNGGWGEIDGKQCTECERVHKDFVEYRKTKEFRIRGIIEHGAYYIGIMERKAKNFKWIITHYKRYRQYKKGAKK